MKKIIIAGMQESDNGIGFENNILHHVRADMLRFTELTKGKSTGNVVVMGSLTWKSLGEKYQPLPGRHNIVLSRKGGFEIPPGVMVFDNYKTAMNYAEKYATEHSVDIYIIGGQQIYEEALLQGDVDKIELTIFKGQSKKADAFFPSYNNFTNVIKFTDGYDEKKNLHFTFLTLTKE